KKAMDIAKKMNNKILKHEASAIYGGLISYQGITGFIKETAKKTINPEKLISYYQQTREGSNHIYTNIMKWSEQILNEKENHHSRVSDTAIIIFRVLDGMRRYLKDTNVDIEDDSQRVIHIGEWDEGNFNSENKALLSFDVTSVLQEKKDGIYNICLDYIDSQSGTEIKAVYLNELQPGGGEKTVAAVAENLKRLSVWEPWVDYKLAVNQVKKGMKYRVMIDTSAMEKGETSARGMIGIRKVK
ncbi:MAG: hypothetical protein JXQ23_10495, partial [Clostridia bacterium]|nr:hypothetical protein [Clostridia bacterium]